MSITATLGTHAELFVARQLQAQGYKILEHSYKKKYGEIDLIASKKDLLVFVEVKMRTTHHFDSAELITPSKQRKIINTAHTYLARNNIDDKDCRFDVALVGVENNDFTITYLENAFQS
jgi:putative endonuclease